MEVIPEHCRDLAVQIVFAVQTGALVQSSPEHILALKVAHEGPETLTTEERHHYRSFLKPILDEVKRNQEITEKVLPRYFEKFRSNIVQYEDNARRHPY